MRSMRFVDGATEPLSTLLQLYADAGPIADLLTMT